MERYPGEEPDMLEEDPFGDPDEIDFAIEDELDDGLQDDLDDED